MDDGITTISQLEEQLADCTEPLDEEEELAAEIEEAEAQQAGLAAFVDSLILQEKVCEVSGGGCGSKRPLGEMEESKGRAHRVCQDKKACKLRMEAISQGGRKRKVPVWLEEAGLGASGCAREVGRHVRRSKRKSLLN